MIINGIISRPLKVWTGIFPASTPTLAIASLPSVSHVLFLLSTQEVWEILCAGGVGPVSEKFWSPNRTAG